VKAAYISIVSALSLICCTNDANQENMNNFGSYEYQHGDVKGDSIPENVVIRLWNEILEQKIPHTKRLSEHAIKVTLYRDSKSFIGSSKMAGSELARNVANKITGKFYIIDYVPKDFRVLGGSFHVFVDGATFETISIIAGV
jgi:hypothetical protein